LIFGEVFTCEKIAYRRMWTKYDSDRARWDGTAPVRVQRLSDATVTNAELTEDAAFWTPEHPAVPAPQRRGHRTAGDRPVQDGVTVRTVS
jgi:hypothetical protein